MITECYAGETLTIGADDLTETVGGSVTSGATVILAIADDLSRLDESTTTITSPSSGDDWRTNLTAPTIPGVYTVKVSATKGGKVWRATQDITVLPF
jgi:hypothetical protein